MGLLPIPAPSTNQVSALTDGKIGCCSTRPHSPPQRLVRTVARGRHEINTGLSLRLKK